MDVAHSKDLRKLLMENIVHDILYAIHSISKKKSLTCVVYITYLEVFLLISP